MRHSLLLLSIVSALALLSSCTDTSINKKTEATANTQTEKKTKDVATFLQEVAVEREKLSIKEARTAWINQNFITDDTSFLASQASQELTDASVRHALAAAQYDNAEVTTSQRRMLNSLKLGLVLPAPLDNQKSAELAQIVSQLNSIYGKGSYTAKSGKTLSLGDMTATMAVSRNPEELLELWQGWRKISPQMKPLYQRQVELANEGAKTLGYPDLGIMWRSGYDMPTDDFAKELDRLWLQVKPLYDDLHCYVKNKLTEQYGKDIMPKDGTIPAHLLGNMWAQSWGNIYDLVAPENTDPGFDLTKQLATHGYDELKMVKNAENFFTSIGFEPLPETFWQYSLFTKPADRDVMCHASAWSIDGKDDIRIKMCIEKTGEDFGVIHHELGHNFYQRAYKNQPIFFQGSANDGFHEAIGDTIALSITPKYLQQIGLIDNIPDESKDLGLLMKMALDKVAFLPFGLLVDKWRWQVFSGEVKPQQYNQAWWQLREKYQGISAPLPRSENDFDPGAKYHIPGNTPYTRYFLAAIQQFDFHRALCKTAGNTEAIHRCSIYNNKAAGEKLEKMLTMGASEPWQNAYKVMTGSEQMDASAILDYFAPLQVWLKQQNSNKQCGFGE